MKLVATLLLVVVMSSADRSDLASHHEDLLHPIYANGTQDLVEVLLLRQEARLGTIETLLEQIREVLLPALLTKLQPAIACPTDWHLVAGQCLKAFLSLTMTWADARQLCLANGGDLATVYDANALANIITFVNANNPAVNIWLGGTDEGREGMWTWVTGGLMPSGAPFWGSTDSYSGEPGGGTGQNCAGLYHPDKYYIHDFSCATKNAPLCQLL